MANEFKVKNGLKFPDNTIQYTAAVSGGGWILKSTGGYTATSGDKILANTSGGAFTVTLPAAPTAGATVIFADVADWGTYNLTVGRNGNTIESAASDLVLDISALQVELIYDGSTWNVFALSAPDLIPPQATNSGKYLTTNGTNTSWSTITSGASITNDTTTNASYYPMWATATTGTPTTVYTTDSKLYFNPSTGTLNCTDFNSLSDRRLKENIREISGDLIDAITPVAFTWKDTGAGAYGVIAQELETIFPDLVSTNSDTGIKSVSYTQMIPLLIQAVKDLKAEIKEMKEQK